MRTVRVLLRSAARHASRLTRGPRPADAVFRINRAPTTGFEAHVGGKTTYDWLNSGPHTRGVGAVHVLPRQDTTLLHGTTAPLVTPERGIGTSPRPGVPVVTPLPRPLQLPLVGPQATGFSSTG